MITLYFLRHGQTDFSRDNAFCGAGTNAVLTADGAAMAAGFARAYSKFQFKAVYCSPMTRARQTAALFSESAGISPLFRDGLREIEYGDWEGKNVSEVVQQYGEAHRLWNADPVSFGPTAGETAAAVRDRVIGVIEEIKAAVAEGPVLLVSHKATIRIAVCELIGIDLNLFRKSLDCPTASVTTVELRKSGPMLTSLADRSHLDQKLRNLPGT